MPRSKLLNHLQAGIGLLLALAVTATLYWPGLNGPFLLDDFSSLNLIDWSAGDPWLIAISRMKEGEVPGRPLAMLSFLLFSWEWPVSAWGFKYTNLMLHLLTGVLWFWLVWLILQAMHFDERKSLYIALLSSFTWLILPINVATTLYVVQRMTQLAALFTLAGIICYLYGRKAIASTPLLGFLLISFAILFFGGLGILSKENAALLPAIILLIEYLILRPNGIKNTRTFDIWQVLLLWLPVVIIVLFLLQQIYIYNPTQTSRDFVMTERLLTEARVLFEYIRVAFLPIASGITVFNDDYTISRGILNPPSTLISIIAWITIIFFSIFYRKRYSILSFAIGWFLVGHLIESTVIPLEIYFDHRNYLPIMGPVFALFYYAHHAFERWGYKTTCIAIFYILILAGITWQTVMIWSNQGLMATLWAERHPHSERAKQYLADYWGKQGDLEKVNDILLSVLDAQPNNAGVRLQLIQTQCLSRKVNHHFLNETLQVLKDAKHNFAAIGTLAKLNDLLKSNSCPELSINDLLKIADALINNNNFQRKRTSAHNLLIEKSKMLMHAGDLNGTLHSLEKALEYSKNVDTYFLMAQVFLSAGLTEEARETIMRAVEFDCSRPWPLRGVRSRDTIPFLRAVDTALGRDSKTVQINASCPQL